MEEDDYDVAKKVVRTWGVSIVGETTSVVAEVGDDQTCEKQ